MEIGLFLSRRVITMFQRARLRTQLLLVVNASLGLLLLVFVVMDYRLAMQSHLREKSIALSEEARTVASAVQALAPAGHGAMQRYVDATCDLMNAEESPGHRIAARVGDSLFESHATEHTNEARDVEHAGVVTGTYTSGDILVEISELRAPLVEFTRRAEFGRVFAIGIGAVIAAALLNGLLLHLVSRPLERTARTIREIGRGNFGTTIASAANKELTELADEVSAMSSELARRDSDRRAQLDRARRLQDHLLPVLPVGGAHIAVEYHPAQEIAGDFVDVITCANGDTILCLADVVGHGIHAAMGSAVLKALVLASDIETLTPAAILRSVNRRYCELSLPEDFASMTVVRVQSDQSGAMYASAGHEPALIARASGPIERLISTGLLLGLDPKSGFDQVQLDLEPGDRIVLLSDGVSEASNADHELLGRAAIVSEAEASGPGDAARLAFAIIHAAERHRGDAPAQDDSTVLVYSADPNAAATRSSQCVT